MPPLLGHEWDGSLTNPPWKRGDKTRIKNLKHEITKCLQDLQGEFCAYCGMPLRVTSAAQIEHIAPKGNGRYPQFMFNISNLVHACTLCNGFEKKEKKGHFNTIGGPANANYELCYFNIVHPYLDNPDDHYDFTQAGIKVLITHKTLKGQKSIAVFELDGEPLTSERGKTIIIARYNVDPALQQAYEDSLKQRQY